MQETIPYNAAASAYIISRSYAQWLVDHSFPIFMPQDILMGSYPNQGKHLTLKMSWDSKEKCYKSPIIDLECGGEGGTGKTTQTYDAPTVDNFLVCEENKRKRKHIG
jgi:GR25 family glycosyltransferase involved in LPS biosynthesis